MGGLIAATVAGAAQGAGTGTAQVGEQTLKAYDANEHEKMKSDLAGEREKALESLTSQHASERQQADIKSREGEGAATRKSQEGIAAAAQEGETGRTKMHVAAQERIAKLGRDMTMTIEKMKATPMVDDRGHVLMVGIDGKPHGYLMNPDGTGRFKSPSLKAGAKEFAESISSQLASLGRAELNPQTMMDPDAMNLISKRRTELTAQLSQVLSTGDVPKTEAPKKSTIADPFKQQPPGGKPAAAAPGPAAAPAAPTEPTQNVAPSGMNLQEQPGSALENFGGTNRSLIKFAQQRQK